MPDNLPSETIQEALRKIVQVLALIQKTNPNEEARRLIDELRKILLMS